MKIRTRKLVLTRVILANQKAKTIRNPLRTDPTRTTGMREHFCKFLDRQFDRLKADVLRAVGTEDWLGVGQAVENYDPDQERDEHGRWTKIGTLAEAIEQYGPVLASAKQDGYTMRVHATRPPNTGERITDKGLYKGGRGYMILEDPSGEFRKHQRWMDWAEVHYPKEYEQLPPAARAQMELEEQKKYGYRENFLYDKHYRKLMTELNKLPPGVLLRELKPLDTRNPYKLHKKCIELVGSKLGITSNYQPFVCNGEVGYFPSKGLIEVPDVRQPDPTSCGAAAAMSVGKYFGVGPEALEQWVTDLGTSEEGTHPEPIVKYLRGLGLQVEAFQHGNLGTLDHYLEKGWPVMCCVQDYGPAHSWEHGHYLVVIGHKDGYIFAQDPAMDNVMVGGHEEPTKNVFDPEEMRDLHGKWTSGVTITQDTNERLNADFSAGDKLFHFHGTKWSDGSWECRFQRHQESGEAGTPEQAIAVMTKAFGLMMRVMHTKNPSVVHFSTTKEKVSRVRLYDTLAKRISEHTGWQLKRSAGNFSILWELHNPHPTVNTESVEELGSLHKPGRVMIPEEEFVEAWHDEDEHGVPYVRFGIAAGPAVTANYGPDQERDAGGRFSRGPSTIAREASERAAIITTRTYPMDTSYKQDEAVLHARMAEKQANRDNPIDAASAHLDTINIHADAIALGSSLNRRYKRELESFRSSDPNDPWAHHQSEKIARFEVVIEAHKKALEAHKKAAHYHNDELNFNTRWAFATSSGKLAAFGRWLKTRVDNLISGRSMREVWRKYVEAGWRKGAERAFTDTHQRQKWERHPDTIGTGFYQGGREEFLRSSFNHPESVEKVKLLAARTFTDLDGVTTAMSTKMARTLADGLTMGQHPHQIAASLVKDVNGIGRKRALLVARHNLIYAHAEGQLDNLERLGVEEVGVAVEWQVTDDDKLCPKCAALAGIVLKTKEAHGLIPYHVGCRCAWIPSFDPPSSPEEVEAAVEAGEVDVAPKGKGIFNTNDDQPRDTLGRFAHVGADRKFTPNDERRSTRAVMWLLDHGEEMANVKHEPISLKQGRDYLKEQSKHDVVVLHSIYQGKLEAEGQVKELLESGRAPASVSGSHSPEAWRNRLAKSGAKHIFVFSDQQNSLNGRQLGEVPGYTKKVVSWDMTVYSKKPSLKAVTNADVSEEARDDKGRWTPAVHTRIHAEEIASHLKTETGLDFRVHGSLLRKEQGNDIDLFLTSKNVSNYGGIPRALKKLGFVHTQSVGARKAETYQGIQVDRYYNPKSRHQIDIHIPDDSEAGYESPY